MCQWLQVNRLALVVPIILVLVSHGIEPLSTLDFSIAYFAHLEPHTCQLLRLVFAGAQPGRSHLLKLLHDQVVSIGNGITITT